MQRKSITVEVVVDAPIEKIWNYWTEPEHIMNWNFASDDWECPRAVNDLREGGRFNATMSAKDRGASFDFEGMYIHVTKHKSIEYVLDDDRIVEIEFISTPNGIRVIETFEMESENSEELQKNGWQAILNNFKKYVEEN